MNQPAVSRRKVTASAIWRATETAGTEAVAFLVFTILARLLAPEDIGAVQLAGSVMTMLQGLLYHGFTEALIQKPDVTEEHHRSVLAANVALSVGLIGFGFAAAWPLGWVLGRGEFPVILCALLPSLLFRGMSSPMLAALRRDLDFRSIALRTLLGVVAGGIVAVFLARGGSGYWALVVQQWSVEVVGFIVLLRASPIKPWRLHWNRAALSELTPVALPVMGAAFLSLAARRLDTLALGMYLSNAAVGIYAMVYRLVFAAQMVTQNALYEVAMVVLAQLNQGDAKTHRLAVLRSLRLIFFVCACAFGLLSVAGPWLVPLVFSPKWAPAAEPLRVLAALSVSGAVISSTSATLMASGHATAFSRLAIGSSFAQVVCVLVAARWGLLAVAWAVGLTQCITVIPALAMLRHYYELRWRDLAAEIGPILTLYLFGLWFARWVSGFGEGWLEHASATLAFVVLMGLGALSLLLKERKLSRRTPTSP